MSTGMTQEQKTDCEAFFFEHCIPAISRSAKHVPNNAEIYLIDIDSPNGFIICKHGIYGGINISPTVFAFHSC